MNKVRQQDNAISLVQKDIPTYFSSSVLATATSEMPIPYKPTSRQRTTKPCILVFFVPSDGMTYHCEGLADIDDVIAKYTSTDKGKKAMQKAEDELHRELYQEVLAGKLNRVKYYRLVNNLDQKTLARRSGIKQPNISRLEKPGYIADADTYKKLAKVFKINYKELLP
jgi:DNA-binding XRE family transcriptional regulator